MIPEGINIIMGSQGNASMLLEAQYFSPLNLINTIFKRGYRFLKKKYAYSLLLTHKASITTAAGEKFCKHLFYFSIADHSHEIPCLICYKRNKVIMKMIKQKNTYLSLQISHLSRYALSCRIY